MDNFAFIIHPIDPRRDVRRKYPLLGTLLPESFVDFFSGHRPRLFERGWPPVYISHITGIRSAATGKEIEGWFVACPYTPRRMVTLPEAQVYRKIVQTGRLAPLIYAGLAPHEQAGLAERLGARLLGLGAFTSVVGDAGWTISRELTIPLTWSGDDGR